MPQSAAGSVPVQNPDEPVDPRAAASHPDRSARTIALIAFLILGILACCVVIYATRWGAGRSLDSTRYLAAAGNLRAAVGLDPGRRLVHYPPLYPIALSLSRIVNTPPLAWARWLNAILLVLNLTLCGLVLLRALDSIRTVGIAIVAVALLAATRDSLGVYSSVWSEPLYLTFMLLTLLSLHIYLVGGRHSLWLVILAGLSVSLACLTRYAGISLIPAGAIAIAWLNRTRGKRWIHAAIFIAIAASLPATWAVYNQFSTGTAANRSIEFHPPTVFHKVGLLTTLRGWFIPATAPAPLATIIIISAIVLGVVAVATFIWRLLRRGTGQPSELHVADDSQSSGASAAVLLKLLLIFTLTYPPFILFSISFVDIRTPLDARILLPTFVTGLMLCAVLMRWIWNTSARLTALRIAIAAFALSLLCGYATATVRWARISADSGMGLARRKYDDPHLAEVLQSVPSDAILYTTYDARPRVMELFDGAVERIPTHNGDPKKDPAFRLNMRDMREQIEDGDAWILYFSHRPKPSELSHAELRQALILQIRGRGEGWILYSRNRRRIQAAAAAARAARTGRSPTTTAPADVDDEPLPDLDRDLPNAVPQIDP